MVVDVLGPIQGMPKLAYALPHGVVKRRGTAAGGGISPRVVHVIRLITRPMTQQAWIRDIAVRTGLRRLRIFPEAPKQFGAGTRYFIQTLTVSCDFGMYGSRLL